nr:reverse transcriptase domain-containing protein [Tanacetum cinerariifolium]
MSKRVRAFIRGERLQIQPKSSDLLNEKRVLVRLPGQKTRMGLEIEVIEGEGRNIGTYAPYARREGFTPLTKTPKEILAIDNVIFSPLSLMVGNPEKRNMNKICDYHQDRGHNTNDCDHLKKQIEEAVASGRLVDLVKDIRQGGQESKGSAKGKEKVVNMVRSQGVRRIHVDGGSSSEVMYEHYFRNLSYQIGSRLKESLIPLVGISGEVSYSMGVIDLEVTIGECERNRTVIIEFTVVKSPSPYNALLGRTGMRSLRALASTIHSMIKFSTSNGITVTPAKMGHHRI